MIGEKFVRDIEQTDKIEDLKPKKNMNIPIFLGVIVFLLLVAFLMPKKKEERPRLLSLSPMEYTQKISDYVDGRNIEVKYLKGNKDIPNRYIIIQDGLRFLTVEFYQNHDMVNERAKQLVKINQIIKEVDSSKDFPSVLDCIGARYFMSHNIIFNNVIIYYSQTENENMSSKLEKIMRELSEKYTLSYNEELTTNFGTVNRDLFEKNVADCLISIDKQIEMVLVQNLDVKKEDVSDFKESIAPFASVKSVELKYKKWKRYYDLIVEGKFKESQEAKEILKRISETIYEPGEYTVGVDLLEGYYLCVSDNKESKAYIDGIEWRQNVIAYLKKGKKVKLYKGQKLYTLENSPQLQITGKTSGVFKVGKHIKAGTYTLSAPELSPTNYWIIEVNNPNDLLSLSRGNIFQPYTGCKKIPAKQKETITLKDGQILYLLDGTLE